MHNSKGEKVRVKAHGGPIDVRGVTVAKVNDKVQLQSVETWFDPLEMFRQVVAGRGETVISRTDISNSTDSESEEKKPVTRTTPAGDIKLLKLSKSSGAAQKAEQEHEPVLEDQVGVTLNEKNSEIQADKLAQVDKLMQRKKKQEVGKKDAEKDETRSRPTIPQLAEQTKNPAEQIARLQADFERDSDLHEPTWEKVENSHCETTAHVPGALSPSVVFKSGCPFMP